MVKLQGQSQDIYSGVALIEQCSTQLQSLRNNVDDYAHRIFAHSCRIAERSQIAVSMPRLIQQQQHRLNPPSNSVEEYFKLSVTIPFLNHLLSDLTSRFAAHVKQSASLQRLLPINIKSDSSVEGIEQAVALYKDVPNADLVDEEFHLWQSRWMSVPKQDRPQTPSKSMEQVSLPNIYCLLKLFATIPLSYVLVNVLHLLFDGSTVT